MNRVNLWHSILSISSACLILMLSRIELIDGSMRTRSFSLREIINGLSKTSLDPLNKFVLRRINRAGERNEHLPCFNFGFVVSFHDLYEQ